MCSTKRPDFCDPLRIMKTTTLQLRNRMNHSPLRSFLLIPFVLACFGFFPRVQANCQEGCDTVNANTFLGDDALVYNSTGAGNTATGFEAVENDISGNDN